MIALLIDDNPDDRALVARSLHAHFKNIQVLDVIDERSFKKVLQTSTFDVVVTDYQLRWSDGLSVLRAVKAQDPACPVVMFTGTGDEEIAVAAMKAGLDDYVVKKPDSYTRLAMVVETTLERRKQQKALQEMELRYRALFESAPIGLYRTDLAGQILEANPAIAEILGMPDVQSVLNADSTQFYADAADRDAWRERVAIEGVVRASEMRMRRKNGEQIWLRDSGRAILDKNGQVAFYIGSLEDITDRKHMEESLQAITQTYLQFGPDPLENINLLAATCGRLLGATAVLYNRLDQDLLCSWGMWNTPPGYNPVDRPQGHICYDVISRNSSQPLLIRELLDSPYALSDPNVRAFSLQTYIGKVVHLGDFPVGSLCVVFQDDFVPSPTDLQTLDLLASAVGVEERRLQAIREREQVMHELVRLATAVEQATEAIFIAGLDGGVIYANPAAGVLTGHPPGELLGLRMVEIILGSLTPAEREQIWARVVPGETWQAEVTNLRKDGCEYIAQVLIFPVRAGNGDIVEFAAVVRDISEQVQRERQLEAIASVAIELRAANTTQVVVATLLERLSQLFRTPNNAIFMLDDADGDSGRVLAATGGWKAMQGAQFTQGMPINRRVMRSGAPFRTDDLTNEPDFTYSNLLGDEKAVLGVPFFGQNQMAGVLWVGRTDPFTDNDMHLLSAVAGLAGGAVHRAHLYEQTRRFGEQMAAVSNLGRALAETLDVQAIYQRLTRAVLDLLPDITCVLISSYKPQEHVNLWVSGILDGRPLDLTTRQVAAGRTSPAFQALQSRQPVLLQAPPAGADGRAVSSLYVPLLSKGNALGVLLVESSLPDRFSMEDASLLGLVGNYAAIALQNAHLFMETEQRLRQLHALHAIDTAITGSLDLRVILDILLGQVITQLQALGAEVMIFDAPSQGFRSVAQRSLSAGSRRGGLLRLGEGLGGRAAMERRVLSVYEIPGGYSRERLPAKVTVAPAEPTYAAPLIVKGQVKGILEIYLPQGARLFGEHLEFLEAVSTQAAIAMENITLFNDLNRLNIELLASYDATLESLSRAIEMRETGSGGHTQRITRLTMDLAKVAGVDESGLEHIWRGARLHDIGKLAVPEKILSKTTPLTEEEESIIQRQPIHAHELLSPISFLSRALEIPYCHREHWDGAGYPRRLAGEQIPLAARIFSVAERWDQLTSGRPNQSAVDAQTARQILRQEAGKRLDPGLVEDFLSLVDLDE